MKKRVLVICTGPRRGGNSETLADALIKGAHEAGHDVDKICLYDKTINFCTGCLACQKSQRCVIHDLSLIHILIVYRPASFSAAIVTSLICPASTLVWNSV